MKKCLMILLAVFLISGPVLASQVNVFGGYNTSDTVDLEIAGRHSDLGESVHGSGSFVVGVEYETAFSRASQLSWVAGLTYVNAEYAKTLAPHVNLKYGFSSRFYGFVGLNYSFVLDSDYEDALETVFVGADNSHDTGALGAQLGLGVEFVENVSAELIYESYRSVAEVSDVDINVDYSGVRLGVKYGFHL